MTGPSPTPPGPAAAGGPDQGASIFLVAAPSGAGKSSLVNALLAQNASIRLSVSHTTRAPRPGEEQGREYFFVSPEEFERRAQRGEFLESAHVHGNRYGTSRRWIEERLREGCDVMLEIDWQGARQVRRDFPQSVGVFILPPSMQALEQRLRRRGQDAAEVIEQRLSAARSELAHAPEFEFVIVNEDFHSALGQLAAIITATRQRFCAQAARRAALFARLGVYGPT